MAKTATRTHHKTCDLLVGSHVTKSRSLKTSSVNRVSTTGHHPVIRPARGSAVSSGKLLKKIDYKSPNVKELTKDLVTRAKKPKVQLSNANHPVRRGKPKTIDGIFQQGRQRPTGPVRTFIVFKASSKHNQVRRRKPKRGLISKLPGERRFSAVPVYNPVFYKKSELKGKKLTKLRLSDRINVQPAKTDDGAAEISAQSEGTAKATEAAAASATTNDFVAPTSVAAERRGAKKGAPKTLSANPKDEPKLASNSSAAPDHSKSAAGMMFEKKAHVGGAHQTKTKPKKKRLSISILQKKPVRRRSFMYKSAKAKGAKKPISKSRRIRKPAALALSRKSLLAIIRPGFETKLKKRIANIQKMKRLERDEG